MKRKKMNHWICLAVTLGLHLSSTAAYKTYYVEDKCKSRNSLQKIEYHIHSEGPDSVGELRTNRFGTYSREGRNCMISIIPPEDYGIVISVAKVDFRNHRRCSDYIKVYHQDSKDGEKLCDYEERGLDRKSYFSEGDIKIFYHTEDGGWGFNDGFRLIFTVTKIVSGNEKAVSCSSPQQFQCANQRCIWIGVTCDGNDNCGDASDEEFGGNSHCPVVSPVVIATVVLMVTVFAAIFIAMLICCCRYRQSSVSQVDVIVKPHSRSYGYVPLRGCTNYGSIGSLPGDPEMTRPSAPPPSYNLSAPYYSVSPKMQANVSIMPPYKYPTLHTVPQKCT